MWIEREGGLGSSDLFVKNGREICISKNTHSLGSNVCIFVCSGRVDYDRVSLPFGWISSPGLWGLMSAAIAHSHRKTSQRNAMVLMAAREMAKSVRVVLTNQGEVARVCS